MIFKFLAPCFFVLMTPYFTFGQPLSPLHSVHKVTEKKYRVRGKTLSLDCLEVPVAPGAQKMKPVMKMNFAASAFTNTSFLRFENSDLLDEISRDTGTMSKCQTQKEALVRDLNQIGFLKAFRTESARIRFVEVGPNQCVVSGKAEMQMIVHTSDFFVTLDLDFSTDKWSKDREELVFDHCKSEIAQKAMDKILGAFTHPEAV